MNLKLRSVVSLFLIALVTLSSVGFTATKHLCGGELVLTSVGYSKKNLSCGMNKVSKCPKHKKASKPCCTNEYEFHQLEENFNHSVDFNFSLKKMVFTPGVIVYYYKLPELKKERNVCIEPPPNIFEVFTILYQSMLI
ncbi:MAG: HYC_CC_PP family protein [Salibacteraceae bacterium]